MNKEDIQLRNAIKEAKEAADHVYTLSHDSVESVNFEKFPLPLQIPKDLRVEIRGKLLAYYSAEYDKLMEEVDSLWKKIKSSKPSKEGGE